MAIYSLNVATVGKSTHASGTAGAHLLYIAREGAAPHVEAEHMPADPQASRAWMDNYEREARSNARLMTKVRIACRVSWTAPGTLPSPANSSRGLPAAAFPCFSPSMTRARTP